MTNHEDPMPYVYTMFTWAFIGFIVHILFHTLYSEKAADVTLILFVGAGILVAAIAYIHNSTREVTDK